MKKLLLTVLAAVGAVLAGKQLASSKREQALWHAATDPVAKRG